MADTESPFRRAEWLFAYGSLCNGTAPAPIRQLMQRHAIAICRGSIGARRVATCAWYPGAVADEHAYLQGILFRLPRPRLLLPRLDLYEGYLPHAPHRSTFERQRIIVSCPRGAVTAWVYLFNPHLAARHAPTERHNFD